MSGDPPSEPPEDGEGDERQKREEAPDRSEEETADPDQPEREAADSETPADDDGSDRDADAEEPAGERDDVDAPAEDGDAERDEDEGADEGEASEPADVDGADDETAEGDEPEDDADGVAEAGDQGPKDGDGDSEGEGPPEDEEDGRAKDEAPDGEDGGEDDGEGEEGEDADEDGDEDDGEGEESEDDDEDGPAADTSVEMQDDTTPIERKTGPASDTEQPLADHIEEMIKRLAVVVIVAGGVSLLAFPFGEDFIIFLWYSVLPSDISQPHVYHPLELVMTQLKAASLLGLVLALPVFVYETYAFMRPGLYPHERRYYLAAVPTSLVLASVGLLFGYFLVLPAVMTYFLYYSRDVVDIAFALGQTFDLMLILLGYLAVVFQIPLFIMLAIMMGLTTRTWLEDRRLIFWGAFLGISFLFSPDPTGMAPIIVAATMVGLFEGTLMLLRWTGR